jgi:YD repeat-containing protein
LALTLHAYDGLPYGQVGTRGNQTLTRKHFDVPLVTDLNGRTLHGTDLGAAFDDRGNRTAQTRYSGAGTTSAGGGTFSLGAPGSGSMAHTSETVFDSLYHSFAVQELSPAPGPGLPRHQAQATYDTRMGTITSVTDENGQTSLAQYDAFGRLLKLANPGDSLSLPTLENVYYDSETPVRIVSVQREESGQAGANRPRIRFYDGLGRVVQSKDESQDGTQHIVRDRQYDRLGQLQRESHPRYVDGAATFWNYVPTAGQTIHWTTTTRDAVGRTIAVTEADGAISATSYEVVGGLLAATSTDPKGHRRRQSSDVFGRMRRLTEFSGERAHEF